MKIAAVIKLILWLTVAAALTVILVLGLGGFYDMKIGFSFNFGRYDKYDESEYLTGDREIYDDIERIDIDWISGSVKLEVYDGDTVKVSESVSSELRDNEIMRSKVEGGTLKIKFCGSGFRFRYNRTNKNLIVKIPASYALKDVKIESVSAEVITDSLKCDILAIENVSGKCAISYSEFKDLSIELVSGRIEINDTCAQTVDLEGVSSNITLDGSAVKLSVKTVSGRISVDTDICPEEVKFETVSGSTELILPEDVTGFVARIDSVSSNFESEFPVSVSDKNVYKYGDGAAQMRFESVSGKVKILKRVE